MADNPFLHTAAAPAAAAPAPGVNRALVAASEPEVMRGANWFWWIAGLSLINTVLIHSDSDTSFVVGLGFTLLADVAFKSIKVIAFGIDFVALGTFVGLGFLGRKGHFWAMIVGAVLYAIDGLIYLSFGGFLPVAFHALALFYIIRGAVRLKQALREAATAPAESAPPPLVPV